MEPILIYDTTLRDGTQGENISFSAEEKLKIALRLDDLGVHSRPFVGRSAFAHKGGVHVNAIMRIWSTIGVSEDIIEASWHALADSIQFKLARERQVRSRPPQADPPVNTLPPALQPVPSPKDRSISS